MKSPEAVSELSDVEEQEQQDDVLSDEDYPISEDEDEETEFKKTSFASSIGKILKSENNSEKTLVLSKAKKTADLEKKKKKSGDFQIVGDDGKTEESEEKPGEEELKRALQKKLYQERKKVRLFLNYQKFYITICRSF
jgi:tRNA G10  N-methylase Trm11